MSTTLFHSSLAMVSIVQATLLGLACVLVGCSANTGSAFYVTGLVYTDPSCSTAPVSLENSRVFSGCTQSDDGPYRASCIAGSVVEERFPAGDTTCTGVPSSTESTAPTCSEGQQQLCASTQDGSAIPESGRFKIAIALYAESSCSTLTMLMADAPAFDGECTDNVRLTSTDTTVDVSLYQNRTCLGAPLETTALPINDCLPPSALPDILGPTFARMLVAPTNEGFTATELFQVATSAPPARETTSSASVTAAGRTIVAVLALGLAML